MKISKIFCMILALLVAGGEVLLAQGNMPSRKINQWVKVWEDNFNGNRLDTAVWGYMDRRNDDSRRYLSDYEGCYSLRKGKLVLKGIVNPLESDTAKYLTGGVSTRFKKAFAPGRIEVRARFKAADGAWPAIWLLPFTPQTSWPACGEIDIMEYKNHDDYVSQTVHTSYTKKYPMKMPVRFIKPKVKSNKFNTYAVEIDKDSVVFFINGRQTLAYPRVESDGPEDQFPFYQDWYLMLDMQLGGSWVGKIDGDQLPAEMEIDWVRYYKKKAE